MKKFIYSILRNRLFYHYVFWITLIISYLITHFYLVNAAGLSHYLLAAFVRNALLIILVYGNVSFLLPLFYQKKKYVHYAFSLLVLILAYSFSSASYIQYLNVDVLHVQTGIFISYGFQLIDAVFTAFRYTFMSIILKLTLEWHDQKQKISEMQVEKFQAEINYLRAQINPHFLFNTLNSVYALTLKKADAAPEVVMRLSKMMDYMLYDSNEVKVPLKIEIENLVNYVELEKIRLNNHEDIQFSLEGNPDNHFVLPLLFLPLVENAFKHGATQKIDDHFIAISLKIDANKIFFRVSNRKAKINLNGNAVTKNRGLGLVNLEKRLKLFYQNRYSFEIKNSDDVFEVDLKLNL